MISIKSRAISMAYRPVIFILITGLFFYLYNIFLVDSSLDSLRFAVAQTADSYDTSDLDGLDIIFTVAMIDEMSPLEMNSSNIMNLEFAKNIALKGTSFQQLDYAKVALQSVINSKEQQRGVLLVFLDRATGLIKQALLWITNLTRPVGEKEAKLLSVDGRNIYYKARQAEMEGDLSQAASLYVDFLKGYQDYDKASLVELRLGYVYHRMGLVDEADKIYRKIKREYVLKKEAGIASTLLLRLQQRPDIINIRNDLTSQLADIPETDVHQRQRLYYEIGAINMKLLDLEEARKFFKRASAINPDSALGVKSDFNNAWVVKDVGSYQDSAEILATLQERTADRVLDADIVYQIADIHHKEGMYQEAIGMYLQIADATADADVAALSLFQAGASYMYDLNDSEKAQEIFMLLVKKYPKSQYAAYLSPDNPVGMFVTYLVPRATRIVAWRVGGLLALSGFTGEIVSFTVRISEENLNINFNAWLRAELPDTVGNIYVDISGTEILLEDGKAKGGGVITMGSFDVRGDAEGHFALSERGRVDAVITKAILANIPIHPALINNALSGLSLVVSKYLPVVVTGLSIKDKAVHIKGYGPKGLLQRAEESMSKEFSAIEIETEVIKGGRIGQEIYDMFSKRFPGSTFSPDPQHDIEDLFYDFFTRMYFYISFKMMESVKDSKLDYQRSVRTLGRLVVKKDNFRIGFRQSEINSALNQYVYDSFPWLIDKNFLIDVKGADVFFKDNGIIELKIKLRIGYGEIPLVPKDIDVFMKARLVIEDETGLPVVSFEEAFLNGRPFPVDKLNQISLRCNDLLKDTHIPLELEEVIVEEGHMMLKGKGARDFVERTLIGDPSLFTVFYVRKHDLGVAGIKQLDRKGSSAMDFWVGDEVETKFKGWQ
jgi:tetratricopeptide (TPR) repeat protein